MTASCASWVATPELYPTEMRATGHSVCVAWSRVGGLIAPFLVFSSMNKIIISSVLGVFSIFAAAGTILLPETSGCNR
jgi:hypothetical protein